MAQVKRIRRNVSGIILLDKPLGFTSNARAASPIEIPDSNRFTAASLNSFVNCLRDNPMTQFSIQCKF